MKRDLTMIVAFVVIMLGVLSLIALANMKVKRDLYNATIEKEQQMLFQLGERTYYPYTKVYWGIETMHNPNANGY